MIIFILALFFSNCNAKGRYECGPHGNFEYCIEGFPGCVVGCHCFPGYYFDTDTKICEPNMKLTQDYRRHYAVGTRPPSGDSETPAEPPSPTTAHALEAHVDEIAKDTGDLSDWLYNQFFKTIENQVINKTDDDELLKETRRSGGAKKRSKNNKKKNFKKSTKRGLRRKLLRISEDDSMFDSSSSDSRSSDSSGSWESWEEDMNAQRGHDNDPNKDHGHRKIVVYSKQPKAPLPSFIFLPNVETPFYPPIGLPVPPMPMYPMIPVPPIQPIIGPPPVINNCTENENTPTTQGPTTTTKPETTTAAITTEEASKPTSPADETDKPTSDATTAAEGTTEPTMRKHLRNQGRKKFLQRLKNRNNKQKMIKRMGTMGGKFEKQKNNHFIDTPQDPSMFASDNFFQQPIEEEMHDQEKDGLHPYDDDVDFKYLTQLIHRVDTNQTNSMPTISNNPSKPWSIRDIKPLGMNQKFNRQPLRPGRLHAELPTRRKFNDCSKPDDTYYSNLGRQIATLIRGIHPDILSEVDIDIAQTNSKTEPFLSENSFAPRSYWERFVRSPLRKDFGHFSKFKDLRVSHEQLFDLENEVEVAASSRPILTLQELENVISAMNQIQKRVRSRQLKQDHYNKPSKVSLNVSLLSQDRSNPTKVPKKLTKGNKKIDTLFNVEAGKVSDEKRVLSRVSRRNDSSTNNVNADKMLSNVTKNNELFKGNKLADELFFNIPRNKHRFIATSTPTQMTLRPHIKRTESPKPRNRPSPIKFNRNKIKKFDGYYFDDIHTASNLQTKPKNSNAFYISNAKPASYFFNEFDFFVKKKK